SHLEHLAIGGEGLTAPQLVLLHGVHEFQFGGRVLLLEGRRVDPTAPLLAGWLLAGDRVPTIVEAGIRGVGVEIEWNTPVWRRISVGHRPRSSPSSEWPASGSGRSGVRIASDPGPSRGIGPL